MSDRDNVIGHFQDAIEASGNGNKWRFVRVDIIEDAIELLKEQEPVKSKKYKGFGGHINYICECGNRLIDDGCNYCSYCGKKVKWDE